MEITQEHPTEGHNVIQSYERDHVMIHGERYQDSLIVSAERIISPWTQHEIAKLNQADLASTDEFVAELVILGTGAHLQFPPPPIMAYFQQKGIGFECMDTGAACRTYNLLLAEDRKVIALLRLA